MIKILLKDKVKVTQFELGVDLEKFANFDERAKMRKCSVATTTRSRVMHMKNFSSQYGLA